MGLRENLTKRPRLMAGLAAVAIVLVAAFSVSQLQSGGRPPLPVIPDQAFYTTDDEPPSLSTLSTRRPRSTTRA